MKWTFDDYRHYSAEHLHNAEKHRIAKQSNKRQEPLRRGVMGKRRNLQPFH